jgi:hypothetical protein
MVLRSDEMLPIKESMTRKRLLDSLVPMLVVAVEGAWLCAIVAFAVWLVVR